MKERHIDNRLLQFSHVCGHVYTNEEATQESMKRWNHLVEQLFQELQTEYPKALDSEVIEQKAHKLEMYAKKKGDRPYWAYSQYYKDEKLCPGEKTRYGITIGHCNVDYFNKPFFPVFVTSSLAFLNGEIFSQQQGVYQYYKEEELLRGNVYHYTDVHRDNFSLYTTNYPKSIQLKKVK